MNNNYSPYIITELTAAITLEPHQFDNHIYKHLKDNLIKRFQGKCFKDYGFITKIYDIVKKSDGYIVAENPKSSATFYVTFTCKLCFPLLKKHIICKIEKANKQILRLINGPINILVTSDRINKNIFFVDNNGDLKAKKNNNKDIVPIEIGTYVKVLIEHRQFNDDDRIIIAIGIIEDIATDDEIKNSYEQEYSSDLQQIVFSEYSKHDNVFDDFIENKNTENNNTEDSEE